MQTEEKKNGGWDKRDSLKSGYQVIIKHHIRNAAFYTRARQLK